MLFRISHQRKIIANWNFEHKWIIYRWVLQKMGALVTQKSLNIALNRKGFIFYTTPQTYISIIWLVKMVSHDMCHFYHFPCCCYPLRMKRCAVHSTSNLFKTNRLSSHGHLHCTRNLFKMNRNILKKLIQNEVEGQIRLRSFQ